MKKLLVIIAAALAAACSKDPEQAPKRAELRLVRAAGGEIALEIDKAPMNVRAIEVELAVEEGSGFEFRGAEAEKGLALDSVRMASLGADRAILFAGSKREVLIPRAGRVATLEVRSSSGSNAGRLSIKRAVVAGADGSRIEATLGPAISVR
jgi:hypothetical protein